MPLFQISATQIVRYEHARSAVVLDAGHDEWLLPLALAVSLRSDATVLYRLGRYCRVVGHRLSRTSELPIVKNAQRT